MSDKKLDKKKSKQTFKPKVQRTSPQQYVKEVRLELKKVAWPSRQEVLVFTGIVLVTVLIFGAYTGLLDFIFQYLLKISTGLK
jgi:preprotein translocase subunit SecE